MQYCHTCTHDRFQPPLGLSLALSPLTPPTLISCGRGQGRADILSTYDWRGCGAVKRVVPVVSPGRCVGHARVPGTSTGGLGRIVRGGHVAVAGGAASCKGSECRRRILGMRLILIWELYRVGRRILGMRLILVWESYMMYRVGGVWE